MILNNIGGNPQVSTPFAYTVTVYGLNNGHVGESWIEGNNVTAGKITRNNAPGNNTANGPALAVNTIPEPSSAILLILGCGLLRFVRR